MSSATDNPSSVKTLAPLLHEDAVPWAVLEERYGALLELVRALLGVVPNCDRYLEIWPPAFRTYNIMVPNLLNLPAPIFGVGGAPGDLVGLGMYVSSRVAECPYCTAHSCSFALRRGATPEKVAQALMPEGASFSAPELATIAAGRSLGAIPCELTDAEREDLVSTCGASDAEWVVMAIVMMGFLNKFMNGIGVELEQPVVTETATTLGARWSPGSAAADLDPELPAGTPPARDGIRAKLRVVPHLPNAIRLDARWQKGTPKGWPAIGEYLREVTGHDFPVLGRIRHGRARRAIGSMLRENLDGATSVVGLETKVLVGAVFAQVVADRALLQDVEALAAHHGVAPTQIEAAQRFADRDESEFPGADPRLAATLILARAVSPSPSLVDESVVDACCEADLQPAAIVEIVCWLSVLQMLHRLTCFFGR